MRHGFLDRHAGLQSPVHSLDPRAKIVIFLVLVVTSATTPPEHLSAFALYAALIASAGILSRVPIGYLLKGTLVSLPFIALGVATVPVVNWSRDSFLAPQGLTAGFNIAGKAWIGVSAVIVLSSTTTFPTLLRAAQSFRAPRVFLELMGFTYRFVFVIMDQGERLARARNARMFGGAAPRHMKVLGQLVATLFVRTQEQAERWHLAMLARGYTGTAPWVDLPRVRVADVAVAAALCAGILAGRALLT